jgi:hypothetical protein
MPRTPKDTVPLRSYIKRLLYKKNLDKHEWNAIKQHVGKRALNTLGLTKLTTLEEIEEEFEWSFSSFTKVSTSYINKQKLEAREKAIYNFLQRILAYVDSKAPSAESAPAPVVEQSPQSKTREALNFLIQQTGNMSSNTTKQLLPYLFENAESCTFDVNGEKHRVAMVGTDKAETSDWRLVSINKHIGHYNSHILYTCLWIVRTGKHTYKTSRTICSREAITCVEPLASVASPTV